MVKARSVAFVTTNVIGADGVQRFINGWQRGEHRAFVLQGSEDIREFRKSVRPDERERRQYIVNSCWAELGKMAGEFDALVVYLDQDEEIARDIIERTRRLGLPAVFLSCRCSMENYIHMTRSIMTRSVIPVVVPILLTDCGGYEGMERLLRHFLDIGELVDQ